jgi:peptidoglycan hydrolase CwlO-like protein
MDNVNINVDQVPAKLTINYADLDAALDGELKKYQGLVVTLDSLKDAKQAATEINQLAGRIDTSRKEAVKEVSKPIKEFESQMKALHAKCKDTRQAILDQVERFEDEVREQARELLHSEREHQWFEAGVTEEFQNADCEDLAIISNVTKAGKLTKAAREELFSRVQVDVDLQNKVNARLDNLDALSRQHDLSAPLTRAHVDAFLHAEEAEYNERLNALIDAEKERAAAAKAQAEKREQAAVQQAREEEAKRQDERIRLRESEAAQQKERIQRIESGETKKRTAEGQDQFRVTLTFDVVVPAERRIQSARVKEKVLAKLADAGVPEPEYITVKVDRAALEEKGRVAHG